MQKVLSGERFTNRPSIVSNFHLYIVRRDPMKFQDIMASCLDLWDMLVVGPETVKCGEQLDWSLYNINVMMLTMIIM